MDCLFKKSRSVSNQWGPLIYSLKKIENDNLFSRKNRLFSKYMALAIMAFSVAGAGLNVAYNEIFLMIIGATIATGRFKKASS